MNVTAGLMEHRKEIDVELDGGFTNVQNNLYKSGRYRFSSPVVLTPSDPSNCFFTLEDMTIGIGFHWERKERQSFRGTLRLIEKGGLLTAINDVPLEDYVASVISSEMSASCPVELLKAHAVISRSWVCSRPTHRRRDTEERREGEIIRWYGREAHEDFDICADDHCQRYQGITKAFSERAVDAVRATAGEVLVYGGEVCDARFSKCCGGFTEDYRAAWEDRQVPYLTSVFDGPDPSPATTSEQWIRSDGAAYCNVKSPELIRQILPDFDQETPNFYRWKIDLTGDEIRELLRSKLGVDPGRVIDLEAMDRGASGRIVTLKIVGDRESLVVGKELEIRRVLSQTHLYSSAFVVRREGGGFTLHGAGWGHGVGLCQIGAAAMAAGGKGYREILRHYYRGSNLSHP